MTNAIVLLTSYTNKNGLKIKGSFPIFLGGISQCCLDQYGNQTITPVNFVIN